jgi:hypothetical protein
MKFVRVMVIGGALASACACSGTKAGGTTAQAPSAPRIPDPCRLLTQAEASEAIGTKLDAGTLKRFGIITRCAYYNSRTREQELFMDVHNETAPVADPALFDSYTHMPDVKPVSGIGDQALWSHSEIGSGLDILKGGRLVQVGLPRTMTTMTPAVERAARVIASRM